jgi:hypothetical protein
MFGSDILEVSVGVALVFVLVSTVCSAVREAIEGLLKTRASYLELAIRQLLYDAGGAKAAKALFNHPSIFVLYPGEYNPGAPGARPSLFRKPSQLPSYIPARSFAVALMDLVGRGAADDSRDSGPLSLQHLRAGADKIEHPALRRALLVALDNSDGDVERVRDAIEAWYDSAMDRVSGWYKRSTQWIIFWIALAIAVGANVNTLAIAEHLFRHDALRSVVVSSVEAAPGNLPEVGYEQAMERLESLQLPIGWGEGSHTRFGLDDDLASTPWSLWDNLFNPIFGWLLTAFAATLGAPFWFDLLNKIMVIRSTVKPREKSQEEGSEDRRPAPHS